MQQRPVLVINFDMSTSAAQDDKQFIAAIKTLQLEKDFKKILASDNAEVFYFKIAKILVNQLGWIIEFDCFQNMRYTLIIPLVHALDAPIPNDDDGDMEEEVKDDSVGVVR